MTNLVAAVLLSTCFLLYYFKANIRHPKSINILVWFLWKRYFKSITTIQLSYLKYLMYFLHVIKYPVFSFLIVSNFFLCLFEPGSNQVHTLWLVDMALKFLLFYKFLLHFFPCNLFVEGTILLVLLSFP